MLPLEPIKPKHLGLLFTTLKNSDSYQWLFNGNDLTNWQQTGGKAKFYVRPFNRLQAVIDSPAAFFALARFTMILNHAEFKADGL